MKLARVGPPGEERPVVVLDGARGAPAGDSPLWDLTPVTPDLTPQFLASGLPEARAALAAGTLRPLAGGPHGFGVPLVRPGKIVGIGLNYASHAAEAGALPPEEPVVFLKATTSLSGPFDPIRLRPGSTTTDYEVELGVVVGRVLRDETDPLQALQAVAGFCLANDVSDRDLQLERGGTWTKGKSADTFCPVGPWLVTPEEAGDPQALSLSLHVNGEPRQAGTTRDMIFPVAQILSYVSSVMTLEPGDLVITGTPAGVAMGRPEPKPYLRVGDVVEAAGSGLGRQRTPVVAARAAAA